MALTSLVFLGGGGHASDLLGVIEACNNLKNQFNVVGIFDGNADPARFNGRNVNLYGDIRNEYHRIDDTACVYLSAIGYPKSRLMVVDQANNLGLTASDAIIHPGAVYVGTGVTLGQGTVVHAGASISVNAKIGNHCYLSHGCLIGHDSVLGDGCAVMPGASLSGEVKLGSAVMVGSGAVILEGVELGDECQVGANAVVTRNVEPGTTVVGIPARVNGR